MENDLENKTLTNNLSLENTQNKHKYKLQVRWHLYYIVVGFFYLYSFITIICVLHFILPIKWQWIDNDKLSILIDTVIKLSVGLVIGKVSNTISDKE